MLTWSAYQIIQVMSCLLSRLYVGALEEEGRLH
jgi:hypothetical protein